MAYTTQKTVTARDPETGEGLRAGLIDPSAQAYPQREVLERETVRYIPPLRAAMIAPNTDDEVNPGLLIEEWSE